MYSPCLGGEPEGSKGPVGPRKRLARGATPVVDRVLGGGVVGDVETPEAR